MGAIILNAVLLGLNTSYNLAIIERLERGILCIFALEMVLKIATFRADFFKNKANVFDFVVVILCFVPEFINVSILRFLRVFTLLRLFSAVPQFKFVIAVMFKTVPSAFCVSVVLMLVLYVYAVLCVYLFGANFPEIFGDLGTALLSLFQIATLDGWSISIAPVIRAYPYAWVIFVSFILVVSFVMLNMIVGLIVDNINEIKEQNKQKQQKG